MVNGPEDEEIQLLTMNPVSVQHFVPREQPRAELFRHLFVGSTSALAVLGGRGQILSTNEAFRHLVGYSDEELRRMTCDDITGLLVRGVDPSTLKDAAHPALATHPFAHHEWELTLVRKNQSLVPVRVTIDWIDPPFMGDFVSLVRVEDISGRRIHEVAFNRREAEVSMLASLLIQSQESERKRLSRELHDDIGQRLSLAASEVALLASLQQAPSGWADRLEDLRRELDGLCTDVHEMSHDLHSYKLQHLGLKTALKDLCRRLSQQNFHVDFHSENLVEPQSKDVALCLYRVAQESLNNALKHAHSLVVSANITKLDDMFYLTVQDSGVGFDMDSNSQGLGLVSMRERIKLIDGTFRIHSLPGRGTEVWVAVRDQPESHALAS
jgi:signal transduction histidine kinase